MLLRSETWMAFPCFLGLYTTVLITRGTSPHEHVFNVFLLNGGHSKKIDNESTRIPKANPRWKENIGNSDHDALKTPFQDDGWKLNK